MIAARATYDSAGLGQVGPGALPMVATRATYYDLADPARGCGGVVRALADYPPAPLADPGQARTLKTPAWPGPLRPPAGGPCRHARQALGLIFVPAACIVSDYPSLSESVSPGRPAVGG
jgi:hypothetical protein